MKIGLDGHARQGAAGSVTTFVCGGKDTYFLSIDLLFGLHPAAHKEVNIL